MELELPLVLLPLALPVPLAVPLLLAVPLSVLVPEAPLPWLAEPDDDPWEPWLAEEPDP